MKFPIIQIFIHILEVCCLSQPVHCITCIGLLVLHAVAEALKALPGQIELIHDNLLPVILLHITVNISTLKIRDILWPNYMSIALKLRGITNITILSKCLYLADEWKTF